MVTVLIPPFVIVSTDMIGVGDHVDEDEVVVVMVFDNVVVREVGEAAVVGLEIAGVDEA